MTFFFLKCFFFFWDDSQKKIYYMEKSAVYDDTYIMHVLFVLILMYTHNTHVHTRMHICMYLRIYVCKKKESHGRPHPI